MAIRLVSVSAGVLLFVAGCADSTVIGLPPEATLVPGEQVDTLAAEHYSGVEDRDREVLRSQAAWTGYWDRIYETRSPRPERPPVDFDERIVVAASMGMQPNGGYRIGVESVYRSSSGLHIVIRETSPGLSCGVTDALTQPVVVVRVPRVDGQITFVERTSVRGCSQ